YKLCSDPIPGTCLPAASTSRPSSFSELRRLLRRPRRRRSDRRESSKSSERVRAPLLLLVTLASSTSSALTLFRQQRRCLFDGRCHLRGVGVAIARTLRERTADDRIEHARTRRRSRDTRRVVVEMHLDQIEVL